MSQRRQFPLGPWWSRKTLACQEQAMESQYQTADVQLEETRKTRNNHECQNTTVTHEAQLQSVCAACTGIY